MGGPTPKAVAGLWRRAAFAFLPSRARQLRLRGPGGRIPSDERTTVNVSAGAARLPAPAAALSLRPSEPYRHGSDDEHRRRTQLRFLPSSRSCCLQPRLDWLRLYVPLWGPCLNERRSQPSGLTSRHPPSYPLELWLNCIRHMVTTRFPSRMPFSMCQTKCVPSGTSPQSS